MIYVKQECVKYPVDVIEYNDSTGIFIVVDDSMRLFQVMRAYLADDSTGQEIKAKIAAILRDREEAKLADER